MPLPDRYKGEACSPTDARLDAVIELLERQNEILSELVKQSNSLSEPETKDKPKRTRG
jgi:hypothetical protein